MIFESRLSLCMPTCPVIHTFTYRVQSSKCTDRNKRQKTTEEQTSAVAVPPIKRTSHDHMIDFTSQYNRHVSMKSRKTWFRETSFWICWGKDRFDVFVTLKKQLAYTGDFLLSDCWIFVLILHTYTSDGNPAVMPTTKASTAMLRFPSYYCTTYYSLSRHKSASGANLAPVPWVHRRKILPRLLPPQQPKNQKYKYGQKRQLHQHIDWASQTIQPKTCRQIPAPGLHQGLHLVL